MAAFNDTTLKPVPGWDGYFVSDTGDVWSHKGSAPRKLRPWTTPAGHLSIAFSRRNPAKTRTYLVHAVVLLAFVGPRPLGLEACHSDGDPANNALRNLRWDTRRSNVHDAIRHQTFHRGERCSHAKLTESEVLAMRAEYVKGRNGYKRLGRKYGVKWTTACAIVTRRTWKHL
jgi:hypothetical protein